jgi:hypothetical protein
MFRKKIINASSNLKKGLDLGKKVKSNGWLDIETEEIKANTLTYTDEQFILHY